MSKRKRTDAELCHTMKTSPPHAKRAWDTLYRRHQFLIRKLSAKYWRPGIDHADLFQEGVLGFRYSCLSFDPSKATFNTHIGFGIMKYCRQLYVTPTYRSDPDKPRNRCKRVPESVSQLPKGEEKYNKLTQPDDSRPRKVRLTPAAYNLLLKKIGRQNLTEDDLTALAIAYRVGSKEERKMWRARLWQVWLDQRILDITQRAAAIKAAQEREAKRPTQRELPFEKKADLKEAARRTQGGLGGNRR